MKLKETEKIQAAADVADAVYFLHGHSKVRLVVRLHAMTPWSHVYVLYVVFKHDVCIIIIFV